MSVRFVIGRSGTGKTFHCLRAIVEAVRADPLGPPIFWIVPRQATFATERQLVAGSGLPAVCRVRVESFDGLHRAILNDCGGSAVPLVTPVGRRIILGHLLRRLQPQLKFFAAVAHHPGLAATLDATFAEFERSGNAPEQVIAALDRQSDADETDDLLRPKLCDLRLLYESYAAFLGQDRLDPHRRNEQVVACMRSSKLLRGATAYVDGFLDFAESERRTICGLATTCARVDVTMTFDPAAPVLANVDRLPDEHGLFHRTEDAYRRLSIALRRERATVEPPLMLRDVHRFATPELREIESRTFGNPPPAGATHGSPPLGTAGPGSGVSAVTFAEADDRAAEVDAAARHVLSLLRGGHRMRDVAVVVRNLDAYEDLIDASFREHGIAFFLDRRRAAAHHPLLQFVRSAVQVATDGWPQPAAFALMKSGLAGVSLDDADAVENYVLDHRIRAGGWTSAEPWSYGRSLTRGEDDDARPAAAAHAARVDVLRRSVVDRLRPFADALSAPGSRPVRETVADLYALLGRFDVANTIAGWVAAADASAQFEQAAEHGQVWAEFVDLLDQFVDLLGDEPATGAEFAALLRAALDAFDLALAPPTLDQVIVGQVDRTRLPDVRATLVLGLADGEFPRTPREDSVLNDRDRHLLKHSDVELRGDGERQLLDERLLAYAAFSSASSSLYLSRVGCDPAGKPQAASPYWDRLRALLPAAPLIAVGSSQSRNPEHVATARQVVVTLMKWARDQAATVKPKDALPGATGGLPARVFALERGTADAGRHTSAGDDANACMPALYQWLAAHPPDGSPVAHARYRAWGALSYRNAASLRPETAAALFGSPIVADVGRLETFAACPFKHFVRHGLGLRERRDDALSAIDLSRVYHDLLERLVRQMIRANKAWGDCDAEWTDARIHAAAHEAGAALRRDLAIDAGRSDYLLARIERTMRAVVARQRAVASRAKLAGGYAGVAFGTGGPTAIGPLRLATPRGRELHVRGRIDRVDLLPGGAGAAVFDYKLTGGKLSAASVYHGLSLQLLTYLLVLQANGHELAGAPLTPAAAFYLTVVRGLDAVGHPDDGKDPATDAFHFDPKARGVFDGTHLPLLDAGLSTGTSDLWHVQLNADGRVGYRNASDCCDADEFLALLTHVRWKLATIADAMAGGDVRAFPYRLGKASPCATCDYRAVCRFDAALNGYNVMPGMKRDDMLAKVKESARAEANPMTPAGRATKSSPGTPGEGPEGPPRRA